MKRGVWWSIGVCLLALFVRLPLLNQSFWMDEAAQMLESMRPLSQQLQILADFQPPLFHYIVHFVTLFGTAEWFVRLVSIGAGIGTVLLTYLFGKLLFQGKKGEFIGRVASGFLAISALHVYYSQELRPYAFAAFLGVLSWYLLVLWTKHTRVTFLVLYTIVSIAGLFTMYVYPFLLLSQLVWMLLYQRNSIKQFFMALCVVTAAFLPWLPSFLRQLQIGTFVRVQIPGWSDVVSVPQWKALPLVLMQFLNGEHSYGWSWMTLLMSGLTVGIAVWLLYIFVQKRKHLLASHELSVVLSWVIVSILGAWFTSFFVQVFAPKRVLFALPGLFLLLSSIVWELSVRKRTLLITAVILMQVVGLSIYWMVPKFQRERWRDVMTMIEQTYPPRTTIAVFAFNDPFAPWRYYSDKYGWKMEGIGAASGGYVVQKESLDHTLTPVLQDDTILVFQYLSELTDPNHLIEAWLKERGYVPTKTINTLNFGFIVEYRRAKTYVYQVQ